MASALIDGYGRRISYVRLSITDRCDFRCRYCMAEQMHFLPKEELLSFGEIETLVDLFIARGVTKLRLTGGEPLVRRGVLDLVDSLGTRLGNGLEELAPYISYGASPRGPIGLIVAARALALIHGRDYVNVDDVNALAADARLRQVEALPLERVVEIHISGIEQQADAAWDDHASRAPDIVYRLLEQVLHRASPRAVTLEYNWSSRFPQAWLGEELERVRGICRGRAVR